ATDGARPRARGLPTGQGPHRTDGTPRASLALRGSWPTQRTAGRDRSASGRPRPPSPAGSVSRARGGETSARAEPPEREQKSGDRRFERADPRGHLAADTEIEVHHTGTLTRLGE